MINVQFKLRKLRPDPLFEGRVFLTCYFNRSEFLFYTSLNTTRARWDEKKQEFKRSYEGWQKANFILDNLKNIVKTYEKDCILSQKPLDAAELKRLLSGNKAESKSRKTLKEWYDQFIAAKIQEGLKHASIRAHNATKEHFLDFVRSQAKDLNIDTYPEEMHQKFLAHLRTKRDYHPNYIGAIHKNLKVFFAYCVENGGKLATNHARLKRIYIPPKREFLTIEELKRWIALDEAAWDRFTEIHKVDLELSDKQQTTWSYIEKTRDIFAFQAMTGLRHSDLFRLTQDHLMTLADGRPALKFIPQKTTSVKNKATRSVTVGLIPAAVAILEKYKGGLFLLPVSHLRHYNRFIQYAAHAAGLTEIIETVEYKNGVPVAVAKPKYTTMTSHMARHTFGTISRVLGMDLSDLKDLMGHSDVRTTQIYDHMANEYKASKQLNAWGDF